MPIADTNVIIRFLLDDNEELSPIARDLINRGDVEVTLEVLAEAVYVLKSVYGIPWDVISREMIEIIKTSGVIVENRPTAIRSLEIFGAENLGFVDCILAARASMEGASIATFDTKLQKYIDRARAGT